MSRNQWNRIQIMKGIDKPSVDSLKWLMKLTNQILKETRPKKQKIPISTINDKIL